MKLFINSMGAVISLTVTLVFFLTKFTQVWPVLIFLPLIIWVFYRIKKHYDTVEDQLHVSSDNPVAEIKGNVIIIPISGISSVVEHSIAYARSLSADQIIAVYIPFEREDELKLEQVWATLHPDVRLVTLFSPYRSIIHPLNRFVDTVERKARQSNYQVTVIIPQFIPKKWWHNFLHNQSGLQIRATLLFKKDVIVTTVPYHLKK